MLQAQMFHSSKLCKFLVAFTVTLMQDSLVNSFGQLLLCSHCVCISALLISAVSSRTLLANASLLMPHFSTLFYIEDPPVAEINKSRTTCTVSVGYYQGFHFWPALPILRLMLDVGSRAGSKELAQRPGSLMRALQTGISTAGKTPHAEAAITF